MNLVGLTRILSLIGQKYGLVIIDNFSLHARVCGFISFAVRIGIIQCL